jgi:hypothetical protein
MTDAFRIPPRVPVSHAHARAWSSRAFVLALFLIASAALPVTPAGAQSHAGPDSTTRMRRYIHNVGYGAMLGFVYAGVDQWQNDPPEWGKDWGGYGTRLASNVGEFVIQESVTDGLSAVMHRPLDYAYCHCASTGKKAQWALHSAITDVLPDGRRAVAVPRIVGAYAGAFAQAAWRPPGMYSRVNTALINGTVSLAIGAGINMYHELRDKSARVIVADKEP